MPQVHLRPDRSISSLWVGIYFWNSRWEDCVFGFGVGGFGVWNCRLSGIHRSFSLRFGRDDDNTSPRSEMTLDCSANFANVTVCNILNDRLEPVTARNWKTMLGVLHFWLCGVAEEAV
jgi:hypothetical protein